jgi:glucose-1-phosphate cytidylyltransferase
VILAGGLGTRLVEETAVLPKPMIPISGRPILWHIMNIYAGQGFSEFLVALGYRGDAIKKYIHGYHALQGDLTVHLRDGTIVSHEQEREDWTVHLVETGAETSTGGRVRRLAPWVGDETFMLTYGDALADIDLRRLLEFHRAHGRQATVTAVRPPARFGALTLDGDLVRRFAEKPHASEGWINGGFFVLEPSVIDRIDGDETDWEREPLESLAVDGELMAYRHEGFWHGVDTQRDLRQLESLCRDGAPPWYPADA